MPNPWNFNPRPPCGGRLLAVIEYPLRNNISIHALRVEGDYYWILASTLALYFNPRPPCGGRRGHGG